MDKPRIYVDFNELVEVDLVSLSRGDSVQDSAGTKISLYEGQEVSIYSDDIDEMGLKDNLIAEGVVERNIATGWSAHVKWCCRITGSGIQHESDLRNAGA